MDVLAILTAFCNIYVYQTIQLHILNLHNFYINYISVELDKNSLLAKRAVEGTS